jgi:hypothetical protein
VAADALDGDRMMEAADFGGGLGAVHPLTAVHAPSLPLPAHVSRCPASVQIESQDIIVARALPASKGID